VGEFRGARGLDPPAAAATILISFGRTADMEKGCAPCMTAEMPPSVAAYVAAVNAFDTDAIVATFASDAYVNDNRREIRGARAIRAFVAKEMVGDHVTMEVREVLDHYGDVIVRARFNGTYDKTNLPDDLVLSSYFSLRDDKIVSLAIIYNQPSPY
jgi:hypothetical protein